MTTFHTHYGALRFYQHCQRLGLAAQMLPVPRELSAACGVCVRFQAAGPLPLSGHEDADRCYQVGKNNAYQLAAAE